MLRFSVGQSLKLRDSLTGAPVRLRVIGLFRPRDPARRSGGSACSGPRARPYRAPFVTHGLMLVNPAAFGPGRLTAGAASADHRGYRPDPARRPGPLGSDGYRSSGWPGNQGLGGLQVSTALPRTLSALADGLVVSRSLLLIGSLQLLLLATAAAALAARLLASQREEETALLSARGGARAQLALASLAEASLLAVVEQRPGSYSAAISLTCDLGQRAPAGRSAGGFFGAVRQVGAAVLVAVRGHRGPGHRRGHVACPASCHARRRPAPAGQAGRAGRTARAGLDAALIILGVLALWELHRYWAAPRLSGSGSASTRCWRWPRCWPSPGSRCSRCESCLPRPGCWTASVPAAGGSPPPWPAGR